MITLSRFRHAAALATGAAALTITALAAAPASAATPSATPAYPAVSPAHGTAFKLLNGLPTGPSTLHVQAFPNDCARIDSQRALIIGTGDCTFFVANLFGRLFEVLNGRVTNSCLFYDRDGSRDGMPNTYDLDSCTVNAAGGTWETLSNNNYSETTDLFNANRGYCLWETGTGTSHPLIAKQCNGSSADDRWQWQ